MEKKMKRSSSLALLSLLLLALQANFILSTAQTFASDPVFDASGAELRQGVSYRILPAKSGHGGGVTLNTSRCPFEIVQKLDEDSDLVPVRFSPVSNDSVIRVNTDTNIMFFTGLRSPVFCPPSPVWRINQTGSEPVFVTIGGEAGNPGRETLPNWFKIQKYEDAYKLQYCPSASLCGSPCGILLLCEDIGVYVENGRRRLALNQPPFKVVFQRR